MAIDWVKCSPVAMSLKSAYCVAGIRWSRKLNVHMLRGYNKCAIERDYISNNCSDGVKETRHGQWSCQAVLNLIISLATNSLHMYIRYRLNFVISQVPSVIPNPMFAALTPFCFLLAICL